MIAKKGIPAWVIGEFIGTFIPVSYTHLDVYKRQAPGRALEIEVALEELEEQRREVELPGLLGILEDLLKAVSYTHLDVYKRQ